MDDKKLSMSQYQYIVGAIVFISGAIIGIIIGNQFPTLTKPQYAIEYEKSFNILLAASVWLGTLVTGSLFLALGKIMDYLYYSNQILYLIRKSQEDTECKEKAPLN